MLRRRHGVAAARSQEVEGHERRRRRLGELGHARRRGMQTQLQRVEVETVGCGNHDFAVDHRASRQLLEQRLVHVGEIAVERLQVPALDEDVGAAPEHDGAKSVPLRLVEIVPVPGQDVGELREHGLDRRGDREGCPSGIHSTQYTTVVWN